MKKIYPSSCFQATRLLLITCAILGSSFLLIGNVAAQSTFSSGSLIYDDSIDVPKSSLIINGIINPSYGVNSGEPLIYDDSIDIPKSYLTRNESGNLFLSINVSPIFSSTSGDTSSFKGNSTLTVDQILSLKEMISPDFTAKFILGPDTIIDLRGSTLTASSLTLADGTEVPNGSYSFHDGDDSPSSVSVDLIDTIPSFKFSNGSKLIHGTLVIDSTRPNTVQLIEGDSHRL